MGSSIIEEQISSFLARKDAEFPELVSAGRHESRTVKYAQSLRASGQLLFTR